jgi:hypothetical protein
MAAVTETVTTDPEPAAKVLAPIGVALLAMVVPFLANAPELSTTGVVCCILAFGGGALVAAASVICLLTSRAAVARVSLVVAGVGLVVSVCVFTWILIGWAMTSL